MSACVVSVTGGTGPGPNDSDHTVIAYYLGYEESNKLNFIINDNILMPHVYCITVAEEGNES